MSRCTNITACKVLTLTELVQQALQNDKQSRDQGEGPGSAELNVHLRMQALAKVSNVCNESLCKLSVS